MAAKPTTTRRLPAALLGVAAIAQAALAIAQGTGAQVYRYEDAQGRVIYSDRPPPSDARNPQAKRVGANYIETNEAPLAAQQATERFPVTLYTFGCGEVCQNAEALLNRRGVPFTTVDVEQPQNAARLQALTGEMTAPVLQVGDRMVAKGYNEARWTAMLDEAGYPKAPALRRAAPPTTSRAPDPPPAPRAETQAATPVPKGSGYPQ
ncbi:MAG: DUF4124 domain-containing protein [Burkholderiales bacterium]